MVKALTLACLMGMFAIACASKPSTADQAATPEAAKPVQAAPQASQSAATAADSKKSEIAKPTAPNAPESRGEGIVTCKKGNDERIIEVVKPSEKECDVLYTKSGDQKKVGGSKTGTDYCDTLQSKVRSNLEKSGYECNP